MGLFIHLYVNPSRIDPQAWQATYDDSLRILSSFPAPLVRYTTQTCLGNRVTMYSTYLVADKGTLAESWQICGDLESHRMAESATLFRDLDHWFRDCHTDWDDRDVLADSGELYYVNCNGRDTFGGKTQGYPFHLALLAVGILFESRFPQSVCVQGDLERTQIDQVVGWLRHDLKFDVSLPVCVDGKRLYQRLAALYDVPASAIERFQSLFRDSDEAKLEHLLINAPRSAVMTFFKDELAQYQGLNQVGAAGLVGQILAVTQDLNLLIQMVQAVNQAKQRKSEATSAFALKDLLKTLVRHFITVDYPARKPLSLFSHPGEALQTIEDLFSQAFMLLGGRPSDITYYCDAKTLLDRFAAYEPHHRDAFQQIIETEERACHDTLKKLEELLAKMDAQLPMEQLTDETGVASVEISSDSTGPNLPVTSLSSYTEYIRNQVRWQKTIHKNPERSAEAMGQSLQLLIEKFPDLFALFDREHYLQKLYFGAYENGIVLPEAAWEAVEQEAKIATLKRLMVLALVPDREISFCRWRTYIMETPDLWPYLLFDKLEQEKD